MLVDQTGQVLAASRAKQEPATTFEKQALGATQVWKCKKRWIAKITQEISIIEDNKRLIEIYKQKIQDKISKVWGK